MELGFEEFAAVETTRLFGLARVLCGNEHDAWDLTQETLTRVSARWGRLAHHDNMGSYARTTLANLHRNSRRRRREVLVADPPDPSGPTATDEPGSTRPGGSISPMIEKPVMLLPEPDSPTRPITSPRFSAKETPSTAFTTPLRVWKCVARLVT